MSRPKLSKHATHKLLYGIEEAEELLKHHINALAAELSEADREAAAPVLRTAISPLKPIKARLEQHCYELLVGPQTPPIPPAGRVDPSWPTEITDTVSAFEDDHSGAYDNADPDPRETGTFDPAEVHSDHRSDTGRFDDYTDDRIDAVADTLGAVASGELDLSSLSAEEMAIVTGDLEGPHGEIPPHLQPFAQQVIRHGRRRTDRDTDGQ